MKRILFGLVISAVGGTSQAESFSFIRETPPVETRVTFHASGLVHVTKVPRGETLPKSYAVKAPPPEIPAAEAALAVTARADGALVFKDRSGRAVLAEAGAASFPAFKPFAVEYRRGIQSFAHGDDEALFGLGDLQDGRLCVNGTDAVLHTRNQGDGIPYVVSERGWALFWDNPSSTRFTDGKGRMTFDSPVAHGVDYWLISGGSADGCVAGMRALTGDVPMLPRWTYGFWQSKERYASQEEILGVVRRYRRDGIPFDGIVQDWKYWGEANMWNAMEFLSPAFPDAKAMVDEIHAAHAKVIVTVWPNFGVDTKGYRAMAERGFLLAPYKTWPCQEVPPETNGGTMWKWCGTRLYDAYSAEARELYYSLMGGLIDLGFDGWWLDSTDPEFMDGMKDLKTALYDAPTSAGPFRSVHAEYPIATVEGVYRHLRADPRQGDRRTFMLTRGAAAGQQRTGSAVWSGDIKSNWTTLRRQIPAGLNYSLTGNPNFNCDLGGFFAGAYNKPGLPGEKNPAYRELYLRWMQLGTFLPMMRSHGTEVPRELYLYGQPGEPVYDALLASVKLRYRLLPYLYAVAADCSFNRGTMMRPLMADFAADPEAVRRGETFLLGRSLLVSPVLAEGESEHATYLPAGTAWYDRETLARHDGGRTVTKPVTFASQPCYVRAGAILPYGPDVEWSDEKPWDDLEVVVFPGADGAFTLYEDDGETYACERGEATRIVFTWNDSARQLAIAAREGRYPGQLETRRFRLRTADGATADVAYDGTACVTTLARAAAPLATADQVMGETWRVSEWSFQAAADYSAGGGDGVVCDVTFTHRATNKTIVRPAFWDGGRTFRVRFAPTAEGLWTWRTTCADDKGLDGRTGTLVATRYAGPLALYRHGFVKAEAGRKYLFHADGTPFFYLGDTHWGMYREEFDPPHFQKIVDRRVEQGFTVYQSEPIDAPFDVTDGQVDAADIAGFQKADRYYRTIADAGLVHANAEFFFAAALSETLGRDEAALTRLSRYWVARFGAYPVMWTLAQEIDNDFYRNRKGRHNFYGPADNPWKTVARAIHACDAYGHPLSGHQESFHETTVTGAGTKRDPKNRPDLGRSAFADPQEAAALGHNWWAVQWSPTLVASPGAAPTRDYWASERPAVNYEGRYCYLWTKDFGARAQGWMSFLNGFCGYGYGAIDQWLYKSTYDVGKVSKDGVDTITPEDKRVPWTVSLEFPSAAQMTYLRRFLTALPWWRLEPDLDRHVFFVPRRSCAVSCAAIGGELYVLYFNAANRVTGSLNGCRPGAAYRGVWFNPRTGEALPPEALGVASEKGLLALPEKPDAADWALKAVCMEQGGNK